MDLVDIAEVEAAARRLPAHVVRTPLLGPLADARPGVELWLKPENLQPTGAFKLRGASNALARLSEEARGAGVVTHSSGNHGLALAYAAARAGVPCTVVMPENAAPVKVAAVRAAGARVHPVPPAERAAAARRLVEEHGLTLVPPYDHPDIIAGQGTVGLEIGVDLPETAVVVVPVGGGGLAAGVATAVTARLPHARVVGVEPELAADAAESLATGRLADWSPERTGRTRADGLRTTLSELTLAHLRARLDSIVTVTEEEILAAMGTLARQARIVAEPSGAVATAAVLAGKVTDTPAVAVVSGGNVDPALLATALAD